jgi:sulfide:quinone oxidoreductase
MAWGAAYTRGVTEKRIRVVIAGAGVAAFEAALALRALAASRVAVELIAPEPEFVYRPLAVAGPFRVDEVRRFPLAKLADSAGATLRTCSLRSIDPERKTIIVDAGEELAYEALLLALGTRPVEAIAGALTFRGPEDEPELSRMLEQVRDGWLGRLVFTMPGEAAWPLPLYELALMTSAHLADRGIDGVSIEIVTPEAAPLELFGVGASEAIRELLETRGIAVTLQTRPIALKDGLLHTDTGRHVRAERVIALPRLEGPRVEGIPCNREGFVEVDDHGRVRGVQNVWAAGDMTDFPVKQGGLAAQQADAAAESIAAGAGADVRPSPFSPVLRGLLLTGLSPRFIRADAESEQFSFDTEPLWWPPGKIVGQPSRRFSQPSWACRRPTRRSTDAAPSTSRSSCRPFVSRKEDAEDPPARAVDLRSQAGCRHPPSRRTARAPARWDR